MRIPARNIAARPAGRQERDYVRAIAWLALAAGQGFAQAAPLLAQEEPKLTAEQSRWVNELKPRLLQH